MEGHSLTHSEGSGRVKLSHLCKHGCSGLARSRPGPGLLWSPWVSDAPPHPGLLLEPRFTFSFCSPTPIQAAFLFSTFRVPKSVAGGNFSSW